MRKLSFFLIGLSLALFLGSIAGVVFGGPFSHGVDAGSNWFSRSSDSDSSEETRPREIIIYIEESGGHHHYDDRIRRYSNDGRQLPDHPSGDSIMINNWGE